MDFVACLGLSQPSLTQDLAAEPPTLFYEAFLQTLSDSIRTYTSQRRPSDGQCALSDLRVAHQRTREAIRRYRVVSDPSVVGGGGEDVVRKGRREDADGWVWVAFW